MDTDKLPRPRTTGPPTTGPQGAGQDHAAIDNTGPQLPSSIFRLSPSMSDISIRVEGLSKAYRSGLKEHQHETMLDALAAGLKIPFSPGVDCARRNNHVSVMNVAEPHVEIGSLITRTPEIKGGCSRIAGTGVTVKRIAGWHRMGMEPEQIAAQCGHLTLAQVHAALSYYYANRAEIDADLDDESAEYDCLFEQSRQDT